MTARDAFSTYHPVIIFMYFAAVMVCSMIFMHPILQLIAMIGAGAYCVGLKGKRAGSLLLFGIFPVFIVTALINPAFNHAGVTILFYLRTGNPVTLESIWYGLSSGAMFVTVIIWFFCYNAVMTSDKFIYLFGKIWPALSLILSMALRFVPRYAAQVKVISEVQRSIGRDVSQGNILARIKHGLAILSMMTTWALENAVETSDSMKARGYGLAGRTSFAIYRFDRRDQIALVIIVILISLVLIGVVQGVHAMRFFPSIKTAGYTTYSMVMYAAYAVLCMLPMIIRLVEDLRWQFTAYRN